MSPEAQEPALPYTPSNTGRRARVGYLGIDGIGFNDLWPMFAGIVLSVLIGLKLFIGGTAGGRHWITNTLVALTPFAAGFGYLRFLVMGRPPHFKGDTWSTLLGLRLDFADPPLRCFPVIPRVALDATAASGPERPGDLEHPRGVIRGSSGGS